LPHQQIEQFVKRGRADAPATDESESFQQNLKFAFNRVGVYEKADFAALVAAERFVEQPFFPLRKSR